MTISNESIFIAGGTGYIGSRLIPRLLARGHRVQALVRSGSERKLPSGCEIVSGDALDANSYQDAIGSATTFVQLVGVAHPSPAKAAEFRSIDLVAGREAVIAALHAGVQHFVYVSVAHPAPVMKAYIAVRTECESLIQNSGLNATILKPWYVLGPGHLWASAVLLGARAVTRYARRCAATRSGYFGTNACGIDERDGPSPAQDCAF